MYRVAQWVASVYGNEYANHGNVSFAGYYYFEVILMTLVIAVQSSVVDDAVQSAT